MIGRLIDARSPISRVAIVMLLVALALAAWAAAAVSPHPAIAALLPLFLGAALWLGRPGHAIVLIDNEGLQPLGSTQKVRFDEIVAITIGGRRLIDVVALLPPGPIEIHHAGRCLVLPRKTNIDTSELIRFLLSKAPRQPSRPVHSLLTDYFAEQQAKFGLEKVHVIHARELIAAPGRRRLRRWVTAAIVFTGIAWIALAVALGPMSRDAELYGAWIALGCVAVFLTVPIYFAMRSGDGTAGSQVAKFPHACIVIGPAGLAMVQGEIQGAIRWDEITKVT